MSKQDKYELNDIVILNDNLEYSIIKKVDNYYVFLSLQQPLKVLVGKIINNDIYIEKNKKIIKEVLSN